MTETTLEMVRDLTLIGMKVKLLDLDGEGIEPITFPEEGEEEEVEVEGVVEEKEKEKRRMTKRGNGLVRSVPGEEERFYYREFI